MDSAGDGNSRTRHEMSSTAGRLLLLMLASAVVFGLGIGREGFINTEGHRIAPAWEMLDSGDYLTQRLFGTIYLRKPPGHTWLLAASTSLFGRNEFAARLVGALAGVGMAVASFFAAGRWFGPSSALPAGVCQTLTPLFWKWQRTAEIDAVNNLLAQLGVFLLLDIFLLSHTRRNRVWLSVAVAAVIAASLLVKGPSALPCYVAAIAVVAIVRRNASILWSKPVGAIVLLSTLITACIAIPVITHVSAAAESVVTQRVFGFEWSGTILLGMITMIPAAFLQSMPASLLLIAPWLVLQTIDPELVTRAKAISLTSMLAVFTYAAVGLTNERYAMPAATFISPLCGFVVGVLIPRWHVASPRRGWLASRSLATAGALLGILWAGYIGWAEPRLHRSSGKELGRQLAEQLPNGADVWADTLIEARPEVLLYATQFAQMQGKRLNVRWTRASVEPPTRAPGGTFLLVRTDDDEIDRWNSLGLTRAVDWSSDRSIHKYRFRVGRVVHEISQTEGKSHRP